MTLDLLVQVATTVAMTAILWYVQLVHYPSFAWIARDRFAEFEAHHSSMTGRIVAPLMLLELGGALWLRIRPLEPIGRTGADVGLVLLAVIWISTFFLQVPCHRALARGFDARVHRRLVATNWIRTLAWSARSGLLLGTLAG